MRKSLLRDQIGPQPSASRGKVDPVFRRLGVIPGLVPVIALD